MSSPRYSLSSASSPECTTKTKRVSTQLSRLRGSGSGSRVSSQNWRRRGLSEGGARSNNQKSRAAAWMWHTRGIGEVAVLPTKLRRNANYSGNPCAEVRGRELQPSRFKREADRMGSAPAEQSSPSSSAANQNDAGHESAQVATISDYGDTLLHGKQNREERPPLKGETFLYDEFELSRLQDLLETQIVGHSKFLATTQPCSSTSSSTTRSSSGQTKPLSALHKLLKKFYTSVAVHRGPPNSALSGQTGPLSDKPRSVQHVIHHHHHHYHHYHELDLGVQIERLPSPTHLQGVLRRRRHSESFSEARHFNNIVKLDHPVDDCFYTDAH